LHGLIGFLNVNVTRIERDGLHNAIPEKLKRQKRIILLKPQMAKSLAVVRSFKFISEAERAEIAS
jgi:hypothetical protein